MEVAGHQLGAEALGLVERRGLERRDDREGRAPVVEQALDGPGTLDEAVVHRLEVEEELADVLEELAAKDAVRDLIEGPAGDVQHSRAALAADAIWKRQPPQQAPTEELRHASRRVEEVDRVPGWRRVDDDQVVLARGMDLEQPLHCDVVVTLHETSREVVVQAILEDAVRRLLVGCVAQHEVVP